MATADEDEVIERIENNVGLSKEKIRKSIKFRYEIKELEGAEEEQAYIITAPAPELGYMRRVNGSVVMKVG